MPVKSFFEKPTNELCDHYSFKYLLFFKTEQYIDIPEHFIMGKYQLFFEL